jgi:hypothetical protein
VSIINHYFLVDFCPEYRTFGGYINETTEKQNLDTILEFLKNQNIPVTVNPENQKPLHFTVGYDAPFKFWNRKNEIWVATDGVIKE